MPHPTDNNTKITEQFNFVKNNQQPGKHIVVYIVSLHTFTRYSFQFTASLRCEINSVINNELYGCINKK